MKTPINCKYYSPEEEKLNVLSHGFGLGLSIIGLALLILRSLKFSNSILTVSFLVYGLSLVVLYSASTFYHYTREPNLRYKLKIFDHIAIFILIAGTYTPFSLVTLTGSIGWIILGVAWVIAFLGAVLKIFFTGKFKVLSTFMYVGTGWIIIFAIDPLLKTWLRKGSGGYLQGDWLTLLELFYITLAD